MRNAPSWLNRNTTEIGNVGNNHFLGLLFFFFIHKPLPFPEVTGMMTSLPLGNHQCGLGLSLSMASCTSVPVFKPQEANYPAPSSKFRPVTNYERKSKFANKEINEEDSSLPIDFTTKLMGKI
ncbi:uncharacterized protein LOC143835620 isoform X3 [Paroedura picta]|uniref:uncharacterized protein LOC143835620 isoform X3 n=1 Tax=Paroedura picta TaxID=143630 RepID=UPI004056BE12